VDGRAGGIGIHACPACLARTWLIGALAGHLDPVVGVIAEALALADDELLAAVGGRRRDELERGLARFDPDEAAARIEQAGLAAVCRCDPSYPARLRDLSGPPAVLHVVGGVERLASLHAEAAVAVVGSRRCSAYGLRVARWLGRALSSAGVPVISGMALGIDTAAHEGALAGGGETVAALAGDAARPYPSSRRALHKRIAAMGAVVSELPPGTAARRWMFPARNRLIAALADMTIVVEAGSQSGALLTARFASELGRLVGAVPGQITSEQARGANALIADGARLVQGPEEVLDALFGAAAPTVVADRRPDLDPGHAAVLAAIGNGEDTPDALLRCERLTAGALSSLAWLELAGYIRREPGGRYSVIP
jgi:DNA processing protein